MSADFARPHHLLRYLVARACRVFSTQVIGKAVMERSQARRGRTAILYNLHFCWGMTEVASTFKKSLSSFSSSTLRTSISLLWTEIAWGSEKLEGCCTDVGNDLVV